MAAPLPATVTVRQRGVVQPRLQDHILAWARDTRSGRLRYIMELSELQRGSMWLHLHQLQSALGGS